MPVFHSARTQTLWGSVPPLLAPPEQPSGLHHLPSHLASLASRARRRLLPVLPLARSQTCWDQVLLRLSSARFQVFRSPRQARTRCPCFLVELSHPGPPPRSHHFARSHLALSSCRRSSRFSHLFPGSPRWFSPSSGKAMPYWAHSQPCSEYERPQDLHASWLSAMKKVAISAFVSLKSFSYLFTSAASMATFFLLSSAVPWGVGP